MSLVWFRATALGAVLLVFPGCGLPRKERPPRLVLLYATCSLNRQQLAPYNKSVGFTPFLSAFAARGVVFTRHYAEAGHSGIDYAALFSGTQADRHGVFFHPKRLPDSLYLVTEAVAAKGYESFFWGGHPMASPSLNYAQGVDSKRTFERALTARDPEWAALLERLRRDGGARAFVITNFTVTHPPYSDAPLRAFCARFPEECRGMPWDRYPALRELLYSGRLTYDFEAAVKGYGLTPDAIGDIASVAETLYKADVWALDGLFGDLLATVEAAGLRDESLIAFTSDHGEVLFEESAPFKWTHGYQLAESDLGVPLVLSAPGLKLEPGTYDHVTRSIDVAPTMAGLSGVKIPPGAMSGIDLSPTLRGLAAPPSLRALSHTMLLNDIITIDQGHTLLGRLFKPEDIEGMWVSMRDGERSYKLARRSAGRWTQEVYDLGSDPRETRNVFDPKDPRDAAAFTELRRYKDALAGSYRLGAGVNDLSRKEQIDRLRSLGYIR